MQHMKILVTGTSGFIGFHTARALLSLGHTVVGIDIENDYYDVALKKSRRKLLECHPKKFNFTFYKFDLADEAIIELYKKINPDYIVNLAAQAGVRHSLTFPHDYTKNNITSFTNILEYAKSAKTLRHVVFASTSSVYGANKITPFAEHHPVDHPLQYYAVTKRTNELMAHSYSNLFNIRATGMRFFTVYGPWGRPDMALFLFTKNILDGLPIDIYNHGNHERDFTYVDDIVSGIILALFDDQFEVNRNEALQASDSFCKYRIMNIGRGRPVELIEFISAIEKKLGIKAIKNYLPLQPGDVPSSNADITKMKQIGYDPQFNFKEGISNFVDWYLDYYQD